MLNTPVIRRSWLIIPGYEREPIKYVRKFLPDVFVLDVECSVPPRRKEEARANLPNAIQLLAECPCEVFVRVDWQTRWCDVKAAISPGLRGIILPGPEAVEDIIEIDKFIAECERKAGVTEGIIELAIILESARGLWNALDLAKASPRITTLGVGRADLTMNLGPDPEGDFRIYPYLMSRVLTIARALGKQPLGAHWRQGSRGGVASPEETLEAARKARFEGFTGCLCAKLEQVAPTLEGFTPTKDEVKRLSQILDRFDKAQKVGQVNVDVDGHLYDSAKAQACRAVIQFARACDKRDDDRSYFGKAGVKQ
jgi:citrate lyase subunit beta/citryl-CoA lyase